MNDYYHVDFREYFVPYSLDVNHHLGKSNITICLDEWAELMSIIPTIHQSHPEFANSKQHARGDNIRVFARWCQTCIMI